MKVNHNALQLDNNYLFSEIASRLRSFQAEHPDQPLLRCSIGDVTRPLPRIIVDTIQAAAEEMAHPETFRGYGAEHGEQFLREAIAHYYAKRNLTIDPDDIFISDGAKSDLGNLCDLFDEDNTVLLPNPVYPVYYDTSIMSGRRVHFLEGTQENDFLPMPDASQHADIIYLCSPNNPTGAVYSREQLRTWVDYALEQKAVLLFDAAYESYIRDPALPH
ncbi:MAG: aminotransferase class I/II-fold pyridoxal phosphate-dependent enzyme, partial [Oscillospiraceae bacterium]|nr:aminotransferase class I/II-fold pyridoxal phosphate-dependent enzyme [Oscillospiraceae bacterium]